jgi:WD repeat and SOF domain-containing protein 1
MNTYVDEKQINKINEKICNFSVKKNHLKKIFQKKNLEKNYFNNPFLKSFRFHQDSILNITTHPVMKNIVFTGSTDGEICLWGLNRESCIFNLKAHEKSVRGISINYNGKFLLSCSDDNSLKLWKISDHKKKNPINIYRNGTNFNRVIFNPTLSCFLTTGNSIILWDFERFAPIQQIFQKGITVSCAKFNLLEHNIILSTASDRSVKLHDLRLHSPVKFFFMEMCSNDILWSKLNPWEFLVANEDSNLYSFDIRKINNVLKIYKGHVMPVQSLDQEEKDGMIISGSLDRTIRVFRPKSDFKANVFSSSRMTRVLCVSFSLDRSVILSGSEDGNMRVWKKPFLKENSNYDLKKKSSLFPKFSRFTEKFFLPKLIKNILKIKMKINYTNQGKKARRIENLLPGTISLKEKLKRPGIKIHI